MKYGWGVFKFSLTERPCNPYIMLTASILMPRIYTRP